MALSKETLLRREAERHRNALELYFRRIPRLALPASCHRVLSALFAETIQKQRKETDELSKGDLRKLTKLALPTQDSAVSRLKKEGWLSTQRIANGGTVFTITIPRKGSLFDLAGPGAKTLNRKKPFRIRPKPKK